MTFGKFLYNFIDYDTGHDALRALGLMTLAMFFGLIMGMIYSDLHCVIAP